MRYLGQSNAIESVTAKAGKEKKGSGVTLPEYRLVLWIEESWRWMVVKVAEKQEWTSHHWTVYLQQLIWKALHALQNSKNAHPQN